jgi:two-component system sensor histidine kinase/response regulator
MINSKYEIVIVDDSKIAVETINKMIDRIGGFIAYQAHSGKDCLRLLGNHDIDIILMDVFMEGMSGFDTARVIRGNSRFSEIPIIFMTAFDPDNEMKEQAIELGGIDYLIKPFTEKELKNFIHLYIRFIERERRINKELSLLNLQLNSEIEQREKILKELQEALDVRHKMFAIVSHDLKNPILGFRSLIDDYCKNFDSLDLDDIREFMQIIQKSSSSVATMLEDLLMWTNFQRKNINFNPVEFDLYYITNQICEQLSLQASNKGISLKNDIPISTMVYADPNLVSLMIRNLISNSIKFTSSGGFITIFGIPNTNEKQIRVSVSDTGVGIPPEKISQLFLLNKSKSTLGTNNETGTGLGLMLVKESAEINQGTLSVSSKVGKGATFTFTLPLADVEITIDL